MVQEYIKQKIIPHIFSKIPLPALRKLTRTRFIVPYYHVISDEELMHVKYLYKYKTIKQFNDDLDFLLKNFSPVSLKDILDYCKKAGSLPQNPMLLTFDDGFREMHDVIAPILLRKGVSATFFVNSDFIDNRELCYQHKTSILVECLQSASPNLMKRIGELLHVRILRFEDIKNGLLSIKYQERTIIDKIAALMDIGFDDYLATNKPYLTSEQISQLIRNGFSIGGHSKDHPLYSSLTFEDQLRQTQESVGFVKEKFSLNYGAFAFPHSDSNISYDFFNEIYGSELVDISFGTSGIISDTIDNNIQRFSLEKPLMPAKEIVAYQFARKVYRIMKGTDRIIRE
jgi:peptidoglycan/xylan/chitin deacetylase (PgdA/CDA1 family)